MKKLLCFLFCVMFVLPIAVTGADFDEEADELICDYNYRICINEEYLSPEITPVEEIGDTVLIPLRAVLEAIGVPVSYDADNLYAVVTMRNGRKISLSLTTGAVNGKGIYTFIVKDGSTYIEMRFFELVGGLSIYKDEDTKSIYITTYEPEGETNTPMVALTFDDGPSSYTNKILDLLSENNSSATFFVIGNRVSSYEQELRKAVSQGCEVLGHSWAHQQLTKLTDAQIRQDLKNTNNAIYNVLGFRPMMYRPTYGEVNSRITRVSKEEGFALICWSVDPQDWRYRNSNTVYNSIMNNVKNGSIVICHDIHGTTATAMERVIPDLIAKGYKLVTVSELLGELEAGKTYYSK